jgi:hypothetical protein
LREKEKLNGASNLRIVLRHEKTEYVITELYPDDLSAGSSAVDRRAHEKRCNDALTMSYLMLAIMFHNLQK